MVTFLLAFFIHVKCWEVVNGKDSEWWKVVCGGGLYVVRGRGLIRSWMVRLRFLGGDGPQMVRIQGWSKVVDGEV